MSTAVTLAPVVSGNSLDVARLAVDPERAEFVATPSYYLAFCHYDGAWNPLTISSGDAVIGFLLRGVHRVDQSCWLGGFIIDRARRLYQRAGFRESGAKEEDEGVVAGRTFLG